MATDERPDSSYHYPPDVFELLVEVITYICKSKPAVIDFFRGAGVPESMVVGWRGKIRENPQGVKKALISRDVLRAVSEAGDSMLGQRREIVKRVAGFEDFSSCWPGDQYKAEALVGRLRQLVNVKDSFTRMALETEKVRHERQEKHLRELAATQKKAEERESIKKDLCALFSVPDPRRRGKALEGVLNRLFASFGILVREAFTINDSTSGAVIEQIDGAIELDGHVYVVEMKWVKARVGTELGQHAARVMVRPPDVRALYISASGYTDAAILIAKEFLSHRLCILMELEEIVACLDKERDLREMLRTKISRAQTHKQVLFRE
jgi:restriction system protein